MMVQCVFVFDLHRFLQRMVDILSRRMLLRLSKRIQWPLTRRFLSSSLSRDTADTVFVLSSVVGHGWRVRQLQRPLRPLSEWIEHGWCANMWISNIILRLAVK